jgi:hypothetical protein
MVTSPTGPVSSVTPLPAGVAPASSISVLTKIWDWIKGKAVIVEEDLAKILGSKAAADLEMVGKTLLESWIGPLATAAIADATDIATGQMSISKAVTNLVASAESTGKTVSTAAALQVIALAQNALPVAGTVTPVA